MLRRPHRTSCGEIRFAEVDYRPPCGNAAVKRCLADQVWSKDGFIEPAAWTMAQNVVRSAGLLKQEVPYEEVIDMRFVKR